MKIHSSNNWLAAVIAQQLKRVNHWNITTKTKLQITCINCARLKVNKAKAKTNQRSSSESNTNQNYSVISDRLSILNQE